jgi:flagellar assembly protein FliH
MPTVLRATDSHRVTASVAFNFDDMAGQAQKYLDQVRAEAGKIVVKAQQEAAVVRARSQAEGRQAAMNEVEQMIQKQLATVLPALRQAILDIHQAKQAWLAQWEASAVHLAAEIAKRLIRGELTRQPHIPGNLIREALQLAAGQGEVRLLLNPADHQALAGQVKLLVEEMAGLGAGAPAQIVADAAISPGGCRVETRFGAIDQTFEAQLARVEEELRD